MIHSAAGLAYPAIDRFLTAKPPVPAVAKEFTSESKNGIPARHNAITSTAVKMI
jgi:hypothetical protein